MQHDAKSLLMYHILFNRVGQIESMKCHVRRLTPVMGAGCCSLNPLARIKVACCLLHSSTLKLQISTESLQAASDKPSRASELASNDFERISLRDLSTAPASPPRSYR